MKRLPLLTTKIIFSSIFGILINSTSNAQTCTSLANSSPLISGTTTIGNHFSAGNGNEVWSSCNSLYFNYRGNVTTTYFWNLAAGTGNSILTLQNSGNVGLSTTTPNFNLQVHGTTDYSYTDLGNVPGGSVQKALILAGKTSRIGLTNTFTGSTGSDGVILRLSQNDFFLQNQENGNMSISTPLALNVGAGSAIKFSAPISTFGFSTGTPPSSAYVNILAPTSNNGLYIAAGSGKYALQLRSFNDLDNAIEVYGSNATAKNFEVKGNGTVYARKYVTTLAAFPDYVFDESYSLLSFSELRSYLDKNNRLPNMPSASQIEKEGADLGELNRLLVEKVEELTLYILQLEERTKALETAK